MSVALTSRAEFQIHEIFANPNAVTLICVSILKCHLVESQPRQQSCNVAIQPLSTEYFRMFALQEETVDSRQLISEAQQHFVRESFDVYDAEIDFALQPIEQLPASHALNLHRSARQELR